MVTASIVVHRTPAGQLRTALESLMQGTVECVYVIDNSPDDSLRVVCREYPCVRYCHVENRGFGAGHNIALRKAIDGGSDYHIVMNADVVWKGDIVADIVRYMECNRDIGLLAPRVYYPDGVLQYSCRMLPTPFVLFQKRFLPQWLSRRRLDRYLLADSDHSQAFDCPYLLGCFMFFRVEALRDVGLFDERFFMYPEDIDISRRMGRRYRSVYWPGVNIVHEHAAASRHDLCMLWIHLSNMVRYLNKWGWFIDKERRLMNRRLMENLPRISNRTRPVGRG